MKKLIFQLLAAGVVFVSFASTSLANIASFQGLGDLPGGRFFSKASDVSADGLTVVGSSDSGSSLTTEAFRWTPDGGMVGLGDLPGSDFLSEAKGVSADGSTVVGNSRSAASGKHREAFRWTSASGMVGLGNLLGYRFSSGAYDVSADGLTVVGYSGREAFRWTDLNGNGLVDSDEKLGNHPEFGLGHLPGSCCDSIAYGVSADGSTVVGYSQFDLADDDEAVRWTSASGMVGLGDLPGGGYKSYAYGISADGSTVVGRSWSDLGYEAFRWTSALGMVGLGDLPGGSFSSRAYDASADGSTVVGKSESLGYLFEAFIWDERNGMRNLRDVLVNDYGLDLTGWILSSASGISDDGLTIVGYGDNPDGYTEAWVATIPRPELMVNIDIKPASCPNPLNVKSKGMLAVAILGSQDFDVNTIDILSVRLDGVAPVRSSYEDVGTVFADANECECTTEGPDGYPDLTLKFKTEEIVEALGEVIDGEEWILQLTGILHDDTPIEGEDCIVIRSKSKNGK